MSERSSLQKVFEGILSSQSFELLKGFSDDATWISLDSEEKELLAQLFLLNAEKVPRGGEIEQGVHAKESYRTACRLSPQSARVWYRLGAFLALSEDTQELHESFASLQKAVDIESRFFDAQYALGSVSLRLAILESNEDLLFHADRSFSSASVLVEQKTLPADFYWHWGIVWSVIAKHSGEPVDIKKAMDYFFQAQTLGCSRPDFFNDYANIVVEFALALSNDALIHEAIFLYTAAIRLSKDSSEKERAVRFFNLGCCYQHLFEATSDKDFFDKAHQAFEMTVSLSQDLFSAWQRWGLLLFRAWRLWRKPFLLEQAVHAFRTCEKNGCISSVGLATFSQAILWLEVESQSERDLQEAYEYSEKAFALSKNEEPHPEVYVALALCHFERGRYFGDIASIEKALQVIQEGVTLFPRSAILWQAVAMTKWAQAEMLDDIDHLRDSLVAYAIASRSFFAQSSQFWMDWAIAFLTLGELAADPLSVGESIAKFEKASELNPEKSLSLLFHMGRAFHFLGDMYDEEEYLDRAITLLTEAFFEDETFSPVLYELALSYFHLGELTFDESAFHMARVFYEELLSLDPEDELGWIDYALVLIHLGILTRQDKTIPQEWFQAEDALSTAHGLGQPLALYQKACLYSLMGNFPEAIEFLYQALMEGELPDYQDVLDDEWLEPISSTAQFQAFLAELEKNPSA